MAPNHRDNLAKHIHISSADDLSYSVSPSSGINDTIQTIVTGRKCWKTMKGKGEVVWPPYLEAALVEGTLVVHTNSITSLPPDTRYMRVAPAYMRVISHCWLTICACVIRPRKVPARRVAHVPLVRPLPDAEQVHLGLYLPGHRKAQDTKASRLPPPAAPRHHRGQAQCVSPLLLAFRIFSSPSLVSRAAPP